MSSCFTSVSQRIIDFSCLREISSRSCFQNSGQICLCTSRLYVQRGIYNELLAKFIPEVKYRTSDA